MSFSPARSSPRLCWRRASPRTLSGEIQSRQALAVKSHNLFTRLQFDLTSARRRLGADHPESSRAQFNTVVEEAHKREFLGIELEARLRLAELARKTGHVAAAHEQLVSLERSARAKRFGLMPRKAVSASG
jgi:hypothetical protein